MGHVTPYPVFKRIMCAHSFFCFFLVVCRLTEPGGDSYPSRIPQALHSRIPFLPFHPFSAPHLRAIRGRII